MDPLSLIGGISATGAIVAGIVKTIKSLAEARNRFEHAKTTIQLLISELTAMKVAVIHIEDWAKYNFEQGPLPQDLRHALQVSFDGCKLAMDILSEEVRSLVTKNPFLKNATIAWSEVSMQEHAGRLRSQVQALQLLVQAVELRNSQQQSNLLKHPRSQSIIQQVADDASTLRSSRRGYSQLGSGAPSIFTSTESTISNETVRGEPDPKDKLDAQKRLEDQKRRTNPFLNRIPPKTAQFQDAETRTSSPAVSIRSTKLSQVDSGFYDEDNAKVQSSYLESKSRHGQAVTNVQRSVSAPQSRPYQPSENFEAADQLSPMERFKNYRDSPQFLSPDPLETQSQLRSLHRYTMTSDSILSQGIPIRQAPEIKKSAWGTVKKITSRASLRKSSNPLLLASASTTNLTPKRVKRQSESDIHKSIDFGSESGLSAPAIVRAAQSASRVEIERLLEERADIEARHGGTGRTALAVASHCGNERVVALLLSRYAQVDTKDTSGMTPLHLAACRGHYQVVEHLLQGHAAVDASGPLQKTPLRLACDGGHYECCELLIRYRAKLNARDANMVTALHAAAKIGDEKIVELLLRHRADHGAKDANLMTAMHYAAEGDFDTVIKTLLSNGAAIDAPGPAGKTPLCIACVSGATQAATVLISLKSNVRHRADEDLTPLHFAALHNHNDLSELLLSHKRVSIDARTSAGLTPLHLAVRANSFSTVELLLRRSAPIETPCSRSLRPIHYAATVGNHLLLQLLLASGANADTKTCLDERPLHLAALSGSTECVTLLLNRKGVQRDARNADDLRPLEIAAQEGHLGVLRALLDAGSPLQMRIGRTPGREDAPLCRAAKAGKMDVLQELLARGASVLQRDDEGWSALRCAAHFGWVECVQEILRRGGGAGLLAGGGEQWIGVAAPGVSPTKREAVRGLLEEVLARQRSWMGSRVEVAAGGAVSPNLSVWSGHDRDFRSYEPTSLSPLERGAPHGVYELGS